MGQIPSDAEPLMDAVALRAAGRAPALPFRVKLADGGELTMVRLLRVLPGKRIVGEARHGERYVLAKLFVDRESEKHWKRECDGIAALRAAGIPTPEVVGSGEMTGGGHLVMTNFLADASSLIDCWSKLADATAGSPAASVLMAPALALLARMHQAGLAQQDLHLGNFLFAEGHLLVIDGDSVMKTVGPLPAGPAAANLGMLLGQLPASWDEECEPLLAVYHKAGGIVGVGAAAVLSEIGMLRAWRLRDYLSKCLRDCTLFAVEQSATRFVSVVRTEAARLHAILANPDHALVEGEPLKSGNTCTVARTSLPDGMVVIKRYNLKSVGHALSRLWRPSRAWHSWREGHRLDLLGIATPKPMALIEERFGPLRRRAWLVTAHCPGPNLAEHLRDDREPPAVEAAALKELFATLCRQRISHGDLKATNLLWHAGRVWLIDLDACTQHHVEAAWRKSWQRDRRRLLRNWPEGSVLRAWFERELPP